MSANCKEFAQSKGWWKPEDGEFDFAKAYADDYSDPEAKSSDRPCGRFEWGKHLLEKKSANGETGGC